MTDVSSEGPSERLPDVAAAPPLEPGTIPRRLWLVALVVGTVAWIAAVVATALTDDTILVPNIIILGTFLVPVCTLLFVLSRPREAHIRTETLMLGFLAGGTAGVVLSAVTEVYLLPDAVGTNAGIGFIEEGGKGLVLLAVATLVRPRVPRDGMVLGATVGAGFAAFESAGYALRVLIDHVYDHPVLNIIQTEAFRAVLAPFGHITWTALIGGALFASSRGGRFHVTRGLVLTILGAVTLHALWDQSYGWAVMLTRGLVMDAGWELLWPNAQFWAVNPTGSDLVWFNTIYDVLLGVWSVIGATWIVLAWRRYGRARAAAPDASAPRAAHA